MTMDSIKYHFQWIQGLQSDSNIQYIQALKVVFTCMRAALAARALEDYDSPESLCEGAPIPA